jgi:hypothetical protein
MFLRRKFKIRLILLFIFVIFLLSYFSLNYIKLKTNNETFNKHILLKKIQELNFKSEFEKLALKSNTTKTLTTKTDKIKTKLSKKSRYVCVDHDSGASNSLVKCNSGVEIQMVQNTENADFQVFLNSVENSNKKGYYVVYAMESEPHS